ncbi:hypothetical protein ACI3KS_06860 [Microbacterium sp. ZW T5_45]|uniref:hypothetical protein n=1 Tax=Microbacterium sp. ZW T5_45 TaxID=3378080 RepID=UPI003853BC23
MLLIVATCKGLTLGGAASIGALIGLWDSRRRRHTSQGPARSEGRRDTSRQSAVQPRSGTTQAKERGGHPFAVASALALAAGTVLTVCLPLEGFLVYFSISTAAEPPTPAEIARYEWTAAGALLLLAAAIVLSAIRRRGGLVVLSTVALLFAVVVANVFAVPRDRFLPAPPPDVVYDGPVCFGTSGDCPGG